MVRATHLYIKFKPKNEEYLTILKRDTTIVYFQYPLDYDIEEEGDYYRDSEVPLNQPTYRYASVEVGKQILSESVEYEVLAKLFIPDDYSDVQINTNSLAKSNSKLSEDTTDLLVYEALRITDNLEEEDKTLRSKSNCWFFCSKKWRPSGNITVSDDELGKIGVDGVKVRATKWFTTHTGFVQTDGSFSCDGRFRGSARYRMDWERYHFALRDGFWSSAEKRGPKNKSPWIWKITGGEHKYYATIFRAAFQYYYKDIKGLRKPPLNGFWKAKLRIFASRTDDDESVGSYSPLRRFAGLGSPIHICSYGRSSEKVYATTIHELAHASHWDMRRLNFYSISDKVIESWARGVQWELTRIVYPDYKGGKRRTDDYTLVVADLIDNDFNTVNSSTNKGYYNDERDQVSGFTISNIEYSLKYARSWNDWRDELIGLRGGYDYNNNITRLFAAYE